MWIASKVLLSSSILVGIKVFHRLVGLVSLLILARLLTPEDFALVALVSIVVYFFDILSNVGSEQYIIQKKEISPEDLNTAWTIDILIKSGFWLLLILFAYLISIFFEQPDLQYALYLGATVLIINALKNPGIFLLKHDFEYREIFWLSVVQKMISFVIVVSIALIYKSFWALIVADVVASLVFSVGSYFIHSHRPTLSLTYAKKQWGFSKWLLFKGVIGYSRSQIDTLIVSKFFPAAQLGHYYMARDIAMIPSHNLVLPAIEPLLAAFKRGRELITELEFQVRMSLLLVAFIAVPITAFMWFFPHSIVLTLLGEQWVPAADLLGVLALLFFYFSFVLVLEQCLIALKKVKILFFYDVISLILISGVLLLFVSDSLVEFGLLRGLLGLLTMLGLLIYTTQLTGLRVMRIVVASMPIIFSTLIALFATFEITARIDVPTVVLLDLLLKLLIFCSVYAILMSVFVWSASERNQEYHSIKRFIVSKLEWAR